MEGTVRITLDEGYAAWEPLDASDDGPVQWTVNIVSSPGPDRAWIRNFEEPPSTADSDHAPDCFRLWWGRKFTFECREGELAAYRAALEGYVDYANRVSEEEEVSRQKMAAEEETYERRIRERKRALDEKYSKKGNS
jgi:hypothetical protein